MSSTHLLTCLVDESPYPSMLFAYFFTCHITLHIISKHIFFPLVIESLNKLKLTWPCPAYALVASEWSEEY